MNRMKVTLIAVGGVVVVASLTLAYLIWTKAAAAGESADDFEVAVSDASRLTHGAVYPGNEAIREIVSNREICTSWKIEALALAARGDRTFEATTPPAFKTFLVDEARRLAALPGRADGKLVKEGFPFGFKDYITGGVLPSEADLPRLQRQWDDVASLVGTVAECGALELLDVTVKSAAATQEQEEVKKPKRGRAKGPAVAETPKPTRETYGISFLGRPATIVKVLNAFAADSRFIVVDDFAFVRETDALGELLGGAAKKKEAAAGGGRGRGRGRAKKVAEEKDEDESEKKGLVTDPLKADPFQVTLTVSVYDFSEVNK